MYSNVTCMKGFHFLDSVFETQAYEIIFNLDISLKMKSLGYFLVEFICLPKSVYPGH